MTRRLFTITLVRGSMALCIVAAGRIATGQPRLEIVSAQVVSSPLAGEIGQLKLEIRKFSIG